MSEILPIHALDPAKRCDPPVLYEGHWYPMICPVEGGFQ